MLKKIIIILSLIIALGLGYLVTKSELRSRERNRLAESIPVPQSLVLTLHRNEGETDCYEEGHVKCKYDRKEYSYQSEALGSTTYAELVNYLKAQGHEKLYPNSHPNYFSSKLFNKKYGRYQIIVNNQTASQKIEVIVYDYSNSL